MGSRKQEYREAVAWLRSVGWRVDEDRGGYPMAYCPTCTRHKRTIHKTPSNPEYYKELRKWVERQHSGEDADSDE